MRAAWHSRGSVRPAGSFWDRQERVRRRTRLVVAAFALTFPVVLLCMLAVYWLVERLLRGTGEEFGHFMGPPAALGEFLVWVLPQVWWLWAVGLAVVWTWKRLRTRLGVPLAVVSCWLLATALAVLIQSSMEAFGPSIKAVGVFVRTHMDPSDGPSRSLVDIVLLFCAVLTLMLTASWGWKVLRWRRDGASLARMVGGRSIVPDPWQPEERRLRNVVRAFPGALERPCLWPARATSFTR